MYGKLPTQQRNSVGVGCLYDRQQFAVASRIVTLGSIECCALEEGMVLVFHFALASDCSSGMKACIFFDHELLFLELATVSRCQRRSSPSTWRSHHLELEHLLLHGLTVLFEVWYHASEIFEHAEELSHLCHCFEKWPFPNSLQFAAICRYFFIFDNLSQLLNLVIEHLVLPGSARQSDVHELSYCALDNAEHLPVT